MAGRRRTGLILAVVGLFSIIAAPIVYGVTMDDAFLRRTGLVAWVLATDGIMLAVIGAVLHRGLATRILAGLNTLLTGLMLLAFFVLARLPAASAAPEVAPEFTLPDHMGRPVALRAALAEGPVLLVFYRGFW